jgi:hypothetical protein
MKMHAAHCWWRWDLRAIEQSGTNTKYSVAECTWQRRCERSEPQWLFLQNHHNIGICEERMRLLQYSHRGPCQPFIGLAPVRSFQMPSEPRSSIRPWTIVFTSPQPHWLMHPSVKPPSQVVEPIGILLRGLVADSPDKYDQRFMLSTDGSPAAAAAWSVGSAPARWAKVLRCRHVHACLSANYNFEIAMGTRNPCSSLELGKTSAKPQATTTGCNLDQGVVHSVHEWISLDARIYVPDAG